MDQTTSSKKVPTCQQILTDGHFCKCPALRGGVFCYYHQRDRQRLRIFQKARELKQMTDSKREGFRPLDELNTEIVESLVIPALDDRASIHVACTNIMRALYCDHISPAKARLMLRAVGEANMSLRRGAILVPYFQPTDVTDPDPSALSATKTDVSSQKSA